MEAIKRIKKYKAQEPSLTVNKIKDKLESCLGLSFNEVFYKDDKSMFHSCRISISNIYALKELNIGTNGKGVNSAYALASAYAEFMERIQNNVLISHDWVARPLFIKSYAESNFLWDDSVSLKYNVAPDEKYFTENQLLSQKLSKLLHEKLDLNSLPYIPFYDVYNEKVTYIPSIIISSQCTSNGMCAGNTPKEAIIQGVCEIMERYALRLIYEKNLSLPSVPRELFKGSLIYDYINKLEKDNDYIIDIKDCSCGIGLPVIGVLIIDRKTTGYYFHAGSDPSPITALERSLTEIFQGRTDIAFHSFDSAYMAEIENNTKIKYLELSNVFFNSTGEFPLSILSNELSYEFMGFDTKYGLSDDNDLLLLTKLVKKLGFDLFVRDSSFLGFPTFRVYIPGMSEIYNLSDSIMSKTPNSLFLTAHNLYKATQTEIDELIEFLNYSKDRFNMLKSANMANIISMNYELSMFILHFKNSNYSKAYDYISKYITTTTGDLKPYKCVRDIIYYKYINNTYDISCLEKFYEKAMIDEFCIYLNNEDFLQLFPVSSCFNCNECKISSSCKFPDLISLAQKIEHIFEQNIPNQNTNAQYFNDNI